MTPALEVRPTSDMSEIKSILLDPEIYERIRFSDADDFDPPTENTLYIGGYINGDIVALGMYYTRKDYVTCHIHVLKDHRGRAALEFGKRALKLRPSDTLYTNIPDKFPDVIRYAKHLGFKFSHNMREHRVYKAEL